MPKTTLFLLAALFAPVLHLHAGTPAIVKEPVPEFDEHETGTLLNPQFKFTVGYDTQRFYRGFVIEDDHWVFGQVDVMAWPFDFYYTQGVTSSGYEEQDVGIGGFIGLPAGFVFRAGWEYDHYGTGDLFIDGNHLGLLGIFHNSKFGRTGFRYVYDGEFEGHLYDLGFQSNPYPITDWLGVKIEMGIRLNDKFYGVSGRGWSNFDVALSAPVRITEHSQLVPFIRYSEPFEAIDDFTDTAWSGGVSLQITF